MSCASWKCLENTSITMTLCHQLYASIMVCGDVMPALTHRQLHRHKHTKPATLCLITWLLPHGLVTQSTTSIPLRGATSTCFRSRSCRPDLKYFTSSTLAHSHGSISEVFFFFLLVGVAGVFQLRWGIDKRVTKLTSAGQNALKATSGKWLGELHAYRSNRSNTGLTVIFWIHFNRFELQITEAA